MNRSFLSVILAVCMIALVSYAVSNAVYSKRFCEKSSPTGPDLAPITSYLQLTPEQQTKIAPIERRFQSQQQAACADMQSSRAELLEIMEKPKPSKAEMDAALGEVAKVQARLQRQTAEYLLAIKPILTRKQRDKLFDLVGQRFCMQGRCGAALCPAHKGTGERRCPECPE